MKADRLSSVLEWRPGDDGPLAGVSIDLDGLAISSRSRRARPSTSSRFCRGDRVFALVKSVALDERAVAEVEA
jgi:hypothetical protein